MLELEQANVAHPNRLVVFGCAVVLSTTAVAVLWVSDFLGPLESEISFERERQGIIGINYCNIIIAVVVAGVPDFGCSSVAIPMC